MHYPPIYHLRCKHCDTHCLAVAWDLRCRCVTCERVTWQVCEVWQRDRTPWVDVPDQPVRLFQIYTPAQFLARLHDSMAWCKKDPSIGPRFAAPGLCRTRTRIHAPWCQWESELDAACNAQCRKEVTYTRVAAATN